MPDLQAPAEQAQAAPAVSPPLHVLPNAGAVPAPGSLLNVQNLYHLQLAQAPLVQPSLLNRTQPSLLHLTQHLEHDPQHQQQLQQPPHQQHQQQQQQQPQQQLSHSDQLEQQHNMLNRLDDTDAAEAGMSMPANTDYKHKPRRKATERPSVRALPSFHNIPDMVYSSLLNQHCLIAADHSLQASNAKYGN